ncbi:hypothetical protein AWB67_05751 [Caballeronia terrestris]|uniref:Lipoprotein n=1 Tax=Caballeronia terrestris TaxID=1226301 RepID=A0A158KIV3_9BURK|nr:hypothetical protein [Caballeronia terrestris]SAL81076.1 hypothetical protein AWB67_05751 [Caballeronia terrestris]
MKNFYKTLIAAIPLFGACASFKANEIPPRTVRNFLLDIQAVADSDNLDNIKFVAEKLKIAFIASPEKAIYDSSGRTIRGFEIAVEPTAESMEYKADHLTYRIFRPSHQTFSRVLISIPVNSSVLCVKPTDLVLIFGEGVKNFSPHLSSFGFTYENKQGEGIKTYFRFIQHGCLSEFGFNQNIDKE